jgi:hypothetical protein
MPIRMLRDWTRSKKMAKLSSCGERLFTRLISVADDFGNYPANVKLINGTCFPEHPDVIDLDVAKWIDECDRVGVIRRYTVDGTKYIHIVNFGQRLDKARAKYPREHEDPYFTEDVEETEEEVKQNTVPELPGTSGKIPAELETEYEEETETEEVPLRADFENPFLVGTVENTAWLQWLDYRKEIKKKITKSTARLQLKFLQGRAGPEIAAILNQSIHNGWTGLFELKTQRNGNNGKGTNATTSAQVGGTTYKGKRL